MRFMHTADKAWTPSVAQTGMPLVGRLDSRSACWLYLSGSHKIGIVLAMFASRAVVTNNSQAPDTLPHVNHPSPTENVPPWLWTFHVSSNSSVQKKSCTTKPIQLNLLKAAINAGSVIPHRRSKVKPTRTQGIWQHVTMSASSLHGTLGTCEQRLPAVALHCIAILHIAKLSVIL